MCGEKHRPGALEHSGGGSPPRVRGKVALTLDVDEIAGITPACAGKSFFGYLVGTFSKDHPRVCGEKEQT